MSGPATILRELHQLHLHLEDLQDNLQRLPRQIKGQQNKVAYQENLLKEMQEGLKKAKVDTNEKELTLASSHKQIEKYERQRNEATSKKEMEALDHEIGHVEKTVTELEEAILQGFEDIEARTEAIPVQEDAVEKVKAECAQFEKDAVEREASLKEMIETTKAKIKELETQTSGDVGEAYRRVFKAMGTDGLSTAEGGVCNACSTTLTPQNQNDLLMDNLVVCKSCGRILYQAK